MSANRPIVPQYNEVLVYVGDAPARAVRSFGEVLVQGSLVDVSGPSRQAADHQVFLSARAFATAASRQKGMAVLVDRRVGLPPRNDDGAHDDALHRRPRSGPRARGVTARRRCSSRSPDHLMRVSP